MTDNLTTEDRKKTMRAVKGKGTKLERRVFAMLAGMSLKGWRKNADYIIGKPDIIFPHEQVAIFVDGCFWHGCPHCQRKLPQTNREYWQQKINRNIELAEQNNQKLANDGWRVIRVWEHELNSSSERRIFRNEIRSALNKKGNNQ